MAKIKILSIISFFVFIMISCGSDDSNPPSSEVVYAGGTPDEPAEVILNSPHEISKNVFYNYFKYEGVKGERIIINALLTTPFEWTDKARCDQSPTNWDTQIIIYDKNNNRVGLECGEKTTFIVPDDGTYVFYFNFPIHGPGLFNIASIVDDSSITDPSGALGSPSSPKQINTTTNNEITGNTFFNYYKYAADEDESIIIHVSLDDPMSYTEKARCGRDSNQDTQIIVYDSFFNKIGGICGEDLTFSFTESGTYIFYFNYGPQRTGSFNAGIIK